MEMIEKEEGRSVGGKTSIDPNLNIIYVYDYN